MTEPRLLPNTQVAAALQAYAANGHIRTLAHEAGVNERSLWRHLGGDATQIRRGNADAIMAALARLEMSREMSRPRL